jgi:DUF4097 and DUF4098 domain-containing protein YvlB
MKSDTVRIDFSTFNGWIILRSAEVENISVEIIKKGTEEGINNIDIAFSDQLSQDGTQIISLIADRINQLLINGQEGVSLEAKIPQDKSYFLDLETSNGLIEVNQIKGSEFKARTSNGKLSLQNTEFNIIEAQTSNGMVSGEIRSDHVDISTSNGRIDITIEGEGDYRMRTSNNNINLNLFNLPTRVDASTSNANVEWTGVPIEIDRSTNNILRAQTEDFGTDKNQIDVNVSTSNGNIKIITLD